MTIFFVYLLKAFITSGVLYLYYWLVLRNSSFHSFNRFYLLTALTVSLAAPLVSLRWLSFGLIKPMDVNGWMARVGISEQAPDASLLTPSFILAAVGILVSCLLLLLLVSKIVRLYRIKAKCSNTRMQGFVLIETEIKQAPFSFFNNLFWRQGLSMTDTYGRKVLDHELTHISQKHTYDKLFTQVVCCLFWANPFYWLIQRELNTVHEFIADTSCIEQGNREELATMLLYSYNEGSYLSPSHAFFQSALARRLHVIGLPGATKYAVLKKILSVVAVFFSLTLLSVSGTSQKLTGIGPKVVSPNQQDAEPITVVGYPSKRKPAQKANESVSGQPVDADHILQGFPLKPEQTK